MEREESRLLSEEKRRKREKILIAVTVLLVLALTLIEGNMASSVSNMPLLGNVIVFIVINVNILLIVFLLFLISRNFFKLFLERKQNVLGSRIRYRLVVTFLVFSLIPMVLFFFLSYKLTTSSINRWIGKQVGEGLKGSASVAREYISEQESLLREFLLRGRERAREGKKIVEEEGVSLPEILVTVEEGRSEYLRGTGEEGGAEFTAYLEKDPVDDFGIHTEGPYTYGFAKMKGGGRIVARKEIPGEVFRNMESISSAYRSYSQVRLLNDPIKATNLGILILVTLLIIFTNTWIGFYLAKDFSIPLKKLAEGTEKLSSAREPVEIEYESDDEFGLLVTSFNRMGKEIITSRRELEKLNRELTSSYYDLSSKAELIEAIITGISTGVLTIDKSGRVSMMNHVARKILEVEGPVEGVAYRELFSQEIYEEIRREAGTLVPGVKETTEKNVRIDLHGELKDLIVRTTILKTADGQYQGTVVTIDDITRIRKMQEISAWREMARRVAHEIKNPLTPIKLSAQRLKKKFSGRLEGEDKLFSECVDTIISEVNTIGNLVDEFYRFARMPGMKKERGDIVSLVKQITANYGELYPAIQFLVHVNGTVPEFEYDMAKMKMVFVNLLENSLWAVKEKGGDGKISFSLDTESSGEVVRVAVEDNGVGIKDEEREKIFDLYYSNRDGGKGVGLSVVKIIMSEHGGKVFASEGKKGGSRIVLELPVKRREREG